MIGSEEGKNIKVVILMTWNRTDFLIEFYLSGRMIRIPYPVARIGFFFRKEFVGRINRPS